MSPARRQFLTDTAVPSWRGLVPWASAVFPQHPRPSGRGDPAAGALTEHDFLAPVSAAGSVSATVRTTPEARQAGEPVALGTPYFTARTSRARCVRLRASGVPDGALDPKLEKIEDSRMGSRRHRPGVLHRLPGTALRGLLNVCPIRNKAITLEFRHNERTMKHAIFIPSSTPTPAPAAASARSRASWKRRPSGPADAPRKACSAHYRLGWRRSARPVGLGHAGSAASVQPADGMRYEHGGRGLIQSPAPRASRCRPARLEAIPRRGGVSDAAAGKN